MKTNQKILLLFQKKVTHGFIFLLLQLRNSHIGTQIFNFIVLSLIITHKSVFTPHISKTYLPISSRELELIDAQKTSQEKW